MKVYAYTVTLRCDGGGKVRVHLPAHNAQDAKQAACNVQLAPLSAVIKTSRRNPYKVKHL